jgi:hypothetical protein
VGRRSCSTARTPPTASEPSQRPPRTLALASPRRVRDVRGEAAYHGDEAAAGGGIGGADDEPEGRPVWYEGLGRYRRAAGPRLGRPAGSSGRAARYNRIGGTE